MIAGFDKIVKQEILGARHPLLGLQFAQQRPFLDCKLQLFCGSTARLFISVSCWATVVEGPSQT
ncbi:hypothetical protein LCGC14_2078590, partial [marine sediment metagenome]